jgi:hypothetical protein
MIWVADLHHFNSDRILLLTQMWIRIRLFTLIRNLHLIKEMRIFNHWSTVQTLHGSILSLHSSIVSVHRPPWLHFQPLMLLNCDFNAELDPAFHSNPDPDSDQASQNNEAPDQQPSFTYLLLSRVKSAT